jgi:hypothetical protein
MAHDTKHGDKTRSDIFAGSAAPAGPAFDTVEDAYWRGQYMREVYFQNGMTYDDYEPAYRFGHESYRRYSGRKFEDIERDMGGQWDTVKAKSRLAWDHAKHAVRAAWDRMEKAVRDKKPTEHY